MASYKDIFVDQGANFSKKIPVKNRNGLPVDITGFSARGQIRKHWSSKTSISFLTKIEDPTSGEVYIGLNAAQTKGLKPGRFMYDIELYNEVNDVENIIRLLEGQITVVPRITQVEPEVTNLEYESLLDDGWFFEEW